MTSRSRTVAVGVLVGLLLTSLLVAVPVGVGAQSGESSNATNESSTSHGDSGYTIEELQRGGDHIAGAPPSLRWLSGSSAVYIDYPESNPIKALSNDDHEWAVENLLASGGTVNQRELRLHYQGARDGGEARQRIKIVYWRVGEERVETENGIVTRPVPRDVVEETTTVEFDRSFDVETIELRDEASYYSDPVRVTMWVEGVDGARWTFAYKPLPTSQAVETTTAGERLWWLIKSFVLPLVVFGLLAASFVLYARKTAKAGPQMGTGAWAFLILVGGFIALYYNYEGIATIAIRGPPILAALTIAVITIPLIEGMDDHLQKIQFVRPEVTEATSASGKEALDALTIESQTETVAQLPDGRIAIVKSGIGKFIARLFGGAAVLEDRGGRLKTRVFDEGKSSTDEWVWIHYDADEVLDYSPEGFRLKRTGRELVGILAVLSGMVAIAAYTGGTSGATSAALFGGAIAVPLLVGVKNGSVSVEFASAHERAAFVSMMHGSAEFADAATLEESRKQTYTERAKSSKEVESVLETRDETLIGEMLGSEVAATVTDGGDGIELDADDGRDRDGGRDEEVDGDE